MVEHQQQAPHVALAQHQMNHRHRAGAVAPEADGAQPFVQHLHRRGRGARLQVQQRHPIIRVRQDKIHLHRGVRPRILLQDLPAQIAEDLHGALSRREFPGWQGRSL
ncbi:hypothetical protein HB662_09215 [Roseomonas frigidaquae]|uniref:Uncharacterized protein n=1 Tax=Falsiroseomonas frigidaquae TaxID=487318 RepID=A0ABX1EXY3_9PROT|nr:hypothetical protein [Falsiroseomonas frigidaquae]NKE44957.1 hypothetical protein [Falsiroseomonas frigidaquae]